MPNARMLGAYIKQQMEEQNVSASSIASLLGCQEVEVERLLCGRVLATYPQMKQIAEYLGISVHELLRNASQLEEDNSKRKCSTSSGITWMSETRYYVDYTPQWWALTRVCCRGVFFASTNHLSTS